MNLRLRQAEEFMLAMGQQVRYQPVDNLKAFESLERIELLANKVNDLAIALGIEPVAFQRWRFDSMNVNINPERALLRLTELLYLLMGTYHTLGLSKYATSAYTEVHQSNLTRVWPDGKVHRDVHGAVSKPDTFKAPDIKKVFAQHREPSLFEPEKPKEVIDIPGIDPDGDVHSNE